MDLISHLLFSLLQILRSFTERTKVEGDCYYYFQCSYSPISSRSLELYPHQYHIHNRLFILVLTVLLLLLNDYSTIFDWLICIPVTFSIFTSSVTHRLHLMIEHYLITTTPKGQYTIYYCVPRKTAPLRHWLLLPVATTCTTDVPTKILGLTRSVICYYHLLYFTW